MASTAKPNLAWNAERMASGEHRAPMARFLAAGGQTRDGERDRSAMARVVEAMLDDPDGTASG